MHDEVSGTNSRELLSPCFWVRRWRASLSETPYAATSQDFWDTAATGYDEASASRNNSTLEDTLALFRQNGILLPGARVLDIGCGTGTLAVALAREGADVTALDFSGGMLACLRKKIPDELAATVHPIQAGWEDINPSERGWTRAFDVVMANMTPAMRTPEALFRMNEVSRGWCFLRGWARQRNNPILDTLWPFVMDGKKDERPPDLLYQFNVLFARGFFPSVSFVRNDWEKTSSIGEAVRYYTRYFAGISEKPEEWLRDTISGHLEEIAVDGMIHEISTGWTGSMLWRSEGGLPHC